MGGVHFSKAKNAILGFNAELTALQKVSDTFADYLVACILAHSKTGMRPSYKLKDISGLEGSVIQSNLEGLCSSLYSVKVGI
ncbi:hypothetical protein QFZ34_002116 [Phyllobacterium ifriqiyense]|uniref:Uncharacterized protein n=1 Tax=Phyllobacterium ifriqiyense TaxID=314238 RepID=A0ABU0S847_9HYPH|nr:hypothetical protein [Phyllobacterium ifriqiyense]MDQ0996934.1 hypothetical protein [Phyllobacterium ifriqiyense]